MGIESGNTSKHIPVTAFIWVEFNTRAPIQSIPQCCCFLPVAPVVHQKTANGYRTFLTREAVRVKGTKGSGRWALRSEGGKKCNEGPAPKSKATTDTCADFSRKTTRFSEQKHRNKKARLLSFQGLRL